VGSRQAKLSFSLNAIKVPFVPHNETLDPRALLKRVSVLLLVCHLSGELSKLVPVELLNVVEVMLIEQLRYFLTLVQVSEVHHSVAIHVSRLPFGFANFFLWMIGERKDEFKCRQLIP
jgi:hypothetical protein